MTDGAGYVARLRASAARAWRSTLMRSGAGLSGVTAGEVGFALLSSILLARQLGLEGFGVYSLALSIVLLAALPVEFGLPGLVMREIARAEAEAGSGAIRGVIAFAATAISGLSVTLVPLALVIGSSLTLGLGEGAPTILTVAVLLIPVNAFCKMLGATLAGRQKVVLGAIPFRLVRPAAFALALAAVSALDPAWLTPARALLLQLGAGALALSIAVALFLANYREILLEHGRTTVRWRAWFAAMLRLSVSRGMQHAQPQLLLLLTGALGSVEAVGLFRVALRGADVVGCVTVVAQTVAAPRFARLLAERARGRLQHLVTRIARIASVLALAGLGGFLLAGHWLLAALFGVEFTGAWSALIVLTAGHAVCMYLGPSIILMNMARREGITLLGQTLALVVALALAGALAGPFGVLGTALARVTGSISEAFFLRYRARRDLKIDPSATAGLRAPG